MRNALKHGIVLVTGWIFTFLGIAGLVLPVLQGVLFLLVGLSILSSEDVWAQSLIRKLRTRFPGLTKRFGVGSGRAHVWVQRVFRGNLYVS